MRKIVSLFIVLIVLILGGVTYLIFTAGTPAGDIDNDGKCTSSDALSIIDISVGKYRTDESQKRICDINGDGRINSSDVAVILNRCTDNEIVMQDFSLSESDKSVLQGASFNVSLKDVRPSLSDNIDVIWSSSNPKVATVNKKGHVETLNCGESTITAVSATDKTVSKSFTLKVCTLTDSIEILQKDIVLKQGRSYNLTTSICPQFTFEDKMKWTSSDSEVVTVKNGVIKAERMGKATVTCTATDGSNKSASCEVTVTAMKLKYVDQLKRGYPTGCEAASCCMLLNYYGIDVDLKEMISLIPNENLRKINGKFYGPDIHEKFVGDPHGYYDSPVPGYGAFSPVVVKALQKAIDTHGGGYTAKMITGCTSEELYSHLRNGQPAIVWATYKMADTPKVNKWIVNSTNKEFSYPKGTHVSVLSGYSPYYVETVDPYDGNGILRFPITKFEEKWNLLGKQAIIMEKK